MAQEELIYRSKIMSEKERKGDRTWRVERVYSSWAEMNNEKFSWNLPHQPVQALKRRVHVKGRDTTALTCNSFTDTLVSTIKRLPIIEKRKILRQVIMLMFLKSSSRIVA
ncbi:unnamed protein product [Sphenostylis stenocarpa]|uniref:Uncharacterized protein n=1 Tax=Sphenostylis stenocarpa TaxID=92480 RepID=A0AA86SD02_9FABA|nr:unnamed protein product [Sphenostylis stenocarpa]